MDRDDGQGYLWRFKRYGSHSEFGPTRRGFPPRGDDGNNTDKSQLDFGAGSGVSVNFGVPIDKGRVNEVKFFRQLVLVGCVLGFGAAKKEGRMKRPS